VLSASYNCNVHDEWQVARKGHEQDITQWIKLLDGHVLSILYVLHHDHGCHSGMASGIRMILLRILRRY
jgi:hypothetical protein